jgi:hypothetical protein
MDSWPSVPPLGGCQMKEMSPLTGPKDTPGNEAEGPDLPADLSDRGPPRSASPIWQEPRLCSVRLCSIGNPGLRLSGRSWGRQRTRCPGPGSGVAPGRQCGLAGPLTQGQRPRSPATSPVSSRGNDGEARAPESCTRTGQRKLQPDRRGEHAPRGDGCSHQTIQTETPRQQPGVAQTSQSGVPVRPRYLPFARTQRPSLNVTEIEAPNRVNETQQP